MKIFKYTLDKKIINKPQILKIPAHAYLVNTDFFNNTICMWYCVTEDDEIASVPFIINFTGDDLDISASHLATVIDHKMGLVYHISIL